MFNIFKKRSKKFGLEKAKAENLISEKEFLKLKIWRADEELKNYLNRGKKKKK